MDMSANLHLSDENSPKWNLNHNHCCCWCVFEKYSVVSFICIRTQINTLVIQLRFYRYSNHLSPDTFHRLLHLCVQTDFLPKKKPFHVWIKTKYIDFHNSDWDILWWNNVNLNDWLFKLFDGRKMQTNSRWTIGTNRPSKMKIRAFFFLFKSYQRKFSIEDTRGQTIWESIQFIVAECSLACIIKKSKDDSRK